MRIVRGATLTVGVLVAAAVRLRDRVHPQDPTPRVEKTPVSARVRRTRIGLGVVGLAWLGYGVWVLLDRVPAASYLGLALWLAGAVVLHDAVLVPLVAVLRVLTHRAGRRLPTGAVAVVKSGFVVGGVLSLVVLPEIWAKHRGPAHPSVLPGNYGERLGVAWLVIAALTALGVVAVTLAQRRAGPP